MKQLKKLSFRDHVKSHYLLYVMALPGVVYLIMFYLIPIAGNIIAFMDYNYITGLSNMKWAGLKHFEKLFTYTEFFRILRNTLVIGFLNIVIGFPAPIILALVLNEIRKNNFRRVAQTIIFLPSFLSWVIVSRLAYHVLNPDSGIVNFFIHKLTGETIFFMVKSEIFPLIVTLTGIWRNSGFACIIYLAALTAIDPQLYEAAIIDGAGKFKQMVNITLPLMIPTMLVVLLLNIGQFLNTGFNQIDTLYNDLVRNTGEILINYTFRRGIEQGDFSFATAVGFFQALVGFILVVGGNKIALEFSGKGLFYGQKKENK